MDTNKPIAALFDLDGVVLDTESQYTVFWDEQGMKYLGIPDFCATIKGQTLAQILGRNFMGDNRQHHTEIVSDLNRFEREMDYQYIAGAQQFIAELRENGVKIAVVTSSNDEKMTHVYRAHPDFKSQFDIILTGDMFERSKPHPDCFLLDMKQFDTIPENSFLFEDSFHGLEAGRASGATLIGLATTNPLEAIAVKASLILDDLTEMTFGKRLKLS